MVMKRTQQKEAKGIRKTRATSLLALKKVAIKKFAAAQTPVALEQWERDYLGRKGAIREVFQSLKELPEAKRKAVAQEANAVRTELVALFEKAQKKHGVGIAEKRALKTHTIDVTLPGVSTPVGHIHLVSRMIERVTDIFSSMGFDIVEGPDIESPYYNFDALNVPADHPSRDLWDTFWMQEAGEIGRAGRIANQNDSRRLLRTHTSPGQVRYMETHKPPFRMVVPGRTYRFENADRTHGFEFHQIEGMMVGPNISAANFKGILTVFFNTLFCDIQSAQGSKTNVTSEQIKVRLRPSFFPFTEPSFEVFMWFQGRWLEVMGAGMVHPEVYKHAGYSAGEIAKIQGFAFGGGIERLIMIKHQIPDMRLLYVGDLRVIRQFS